MNKIQHEHYITNQQGCQQLRLKICGGIEFKAEKDEFFRQVSDQLGRLDYREPDRKSDSRRRRLRRMQ